jgi:hypothetical protein
VAHISAAASPAGRRGGRKLILKSALTMVQRTQRLDRPNDRLDFAGNAAVQLRSSSRLKLAGDDWPGIRLPRLIAERLTRRFSTDGSGLVLK